MQTALMVAVRIATMAVRIVTWAEAVMQGAEDAMPEGTAWAGIPIQGTAVLTAWCLNLGN